MLLLENMDADALTRRLSPTAIRTSDYLDLINGPGNTGTCTGYACQERLGITPTVVALGTKLKLLKIDIDQVTGVQM